MTAKSDFDQLVAEGGFVLRQPCFTYCLQLRTTTLYLTSYIAHMLMIACAYGKAISFAMSELLGTKSTWNGSGWLFAVLVKASTSMSIS